VGAVEDIGGGGDFRLVGGSSRGGVVSRFRF
jgi:hypothetical protein